MCSTRSPRTSSVCMARRLGAVSCSTSTLFVGWVVGDARAHVPLDHELNHAHSNTGACNVRFRESLLIGDASCGCPQLPIYLCGPPAGHTCKSRRPAAARAGPAVDEPDSRVFTSRAIHASHELPAHTKPTASPTGEWKGPTRRVQGHIHAHNSRCRAPQGQDGPTVRVKAQHCANRHSSPWHRQARLTDYGEQSDRPGTRGSRSPHAGDECVDIVAAEAVSDHLRRHAARSVRCGYMGRWLG